MTRAPDLPRSRTGSANASRRRLLAALPAALALAGMASWQGMARAATTGPAGEAATPSAQLQVSEADAARLRQGKHRAALLWHTSSDFINAVSAGAQDEFKRLGIAVVAVADAAFDAARQKSDIETALAKKPDVMLSLPLDPVSAAAAFRPAQAKGVKLVFLSNQPKGYQAGRDYVAICTDDLEAMGESAALALGEAMRGQGDVAYLFHEADYYVTNQRDRAFRKTLQARFPKIRLVAETGVADPARAEEQMAGLLTRFPKLGGVYAPWAEPGEGVLAALRAAGRRDVRLVTLDLSEPLALDMAKGGQTVALVADRAYELGRSMAAAAAYGLLGKPVPPLLIAPALRVQRANLEQGWSDALHRPLPASVKAALAQGGGAR